MEMIEVKATVVFQKMSWNELFAKYSNFGLKQENEHEYHIQHISISLSTIFPLKQIIFIFWTKYPPKIISNLKAWPSN